MRILIVIFNYMRVGFWLYLVCFVDLLSEAPGEISRESGIRWYYGLGEVSVCFLLCVKNASYVLLEDVSG